MKWNDEEQVKNIAHISAAVQTELKIDLHTWLERLSGMDSNSRFLSVCLYTSG